MSATEQLRLLSGEFFLGEYALIAQFGESLELLDHVNRVSGSGSLLRWSRGGCGRGELLCVSGLLIRRDTSADGSGRAGDERSATGGSGDSSGTT